MKRFPVMLLVVAFVIALCLPAYCLAGDAPAAPSVQKSVQKTPVQKESLKLQVEVPKATQKTPVQKEVIQKDCVVTVRHRKRFIFCRRCHGNPHRVAVRVQTYGCLVCVGGCCCR